MQDRSKGHSEWTRSVNVTTRGRPSHHPPMSPAAIKFVKLSALVMLLCSVHCAAGRYTMRDARSKHKKISSCSYYGHACWGAHGKRSDSSAPDKVSAFTLPEDAQNFILLDRLFRDGKRGGQEGHNAVPYPKLDSINKEKLMIDYGEDVRPWQSGWENLKGEGEGRVSDSGGSLGVKEDVLGNGIENERIIADMNNFEETGNYLTENGNTGNAYMTMHSLSPMELLNFRYLLKKHLSKNN